jgi:phosphoribosylaminoimidazolecarboxamide formyltransferase / IMP cyclohydrolase
VAVDKNALISVADKQGIISFAEGLHELKYNIFASAGTAKMLNQASVPAHDVAELVGGAPILGHRVVTLSRQIYAGLLADPNNKAHVEELKRLGIPLLGLVCVDMYPLRAAISGGSNETEITETTDVGGPTMLHAAAKGRRIVLSQPQQRPLVLDWMRQGQPYDENVRRTLAAVAEAEVASYMGASAQYLGGLVLANEPQGPHATLLRQGLPQAA